MLRTAVALALAALSCKGGSARHDPEMTAASVEAGAASSEPTSEPGADAAALAGDAGDLPKVAALESPTPIFSEMAWPAHDPSKASEDRKGVIRLGYLRKGAIVPVRGEPENKSNCTEGWYELLSGGYVCGRFLTTDLKHKELEKAPHPPYTDRPLPYDYGLNLTNGTPMYRRPPLRRERAEFEKGLQVGRTKKKNADATDAAQVPAADDGSGTDKPWFLKNHNGQRPQVTIDDLKGESTLIEQRMVRGFYLGLDREIPAFSGRIWRTTRGMYVPRDHVLVHKPSTEFEGVWMNKEGEARQLPLAFVVGIRGWKYAFDEEAKKMKRSEKVDRFAIVQLTGKGQQIEQYGYHQTSEGWWLRDADAAIARTMPPPKEVSPGEKWIDVNLTSQTLVAYEGEKPVFATIVSSGRHDDNDKAKDHRTVTGAFRIFEKHIAATMEADTASDGPYKIEDVPWIMYFEGSYALHGAFWHASFGRERSHGCVNMQPIDAKNLFEWTGPSLPAGWHGVKATDKNPGTRVFVHEDPKPEDVKPADDKADKKPEGDKKTADRDKTPPDKRPPD